MTAVDLSAMGRYATVVVDPPWPLAIMRGDVPGKWKAAWTGIEYDKMSLEDISTLPIQSVLSDNARLFIWTTNRFLKDALCLIDDWGCDYSFTMTWVKNRGPQLPQSPCFNSEFCIVGKRGVIAWQDTKAFRTANYWDWCGGSVKPEGFYDLLRRVTPGPRLDVFGRRRIAGFDSWGNEAPEGPALPSHYQQVML